ncbi:MAG: hypothetical protein HC913_06295 [Microscillaceae bacterium]|nr:hypothetical protein [Microscillaceae bacterium]
MCILIFPFSCEAEGRKIVQAEVIAPCALRHRFAPPRHKAGSGIPTIQELLEHKISKTKECATQVSNRGIQREQSPLDTRMKSENANQRAYKYMLADIY